MKVNYTAEIKLNNYKEISKKHGLDEEGDVTEFFRNKVDTYSDPYIPYSSGSDIHLKKFKTYPDKSTIQYEAPYAHYHFVGKKAIGPSKPLGVKRVISDIDMKYQGAPKRGPNWAERMMNDKEQDIIKDVQEFIDNGGK